jgi:hypothetical protein
VLVPFKKNSDETFISIIQIEIFIIIPALTISQTRSDIEKIVTESSVELLNDVLRNMKLNVCIKYELLLVERSNKNLTGTLRSLSPTCFFIIPFLSFYLSYVWKNVNVEIL